MDVIGVVLALIAVILSGINFIRSLWKKEKN